MAAHTPLICLLAKEIWHLALPNNIHLLAEHLLRVDNDFADLFSRMHQFHDWKLLPIRISNFWAVYHLKKCEMPKLHLQVPTPTVHDWYTMDELVRDVCLHFSTPPSATLRGEEVEATINDPLSLGFNLVLTTLIFHSTWDIYQPTWEAYNLRQGWVSHSYPRQLSLVIWLLCPRILVHKPSPEMYVHLKESQKKSFVHYCISKNLDPLKLIVKSRASAPIKMAASRWAAVKYAHHRRFHGD